MDVQETKGDCTESQTKIFVNLPVKDIDRSMVFFKKLGYTFNPQFTDQNAACLVITDDIYAMLLKEDFFKTFISKGIADARRSTEVLLALSMESREKVDELADRALAAGATARKEPMEMEGMYQRSFDDLDGHGWEVFWMDPRQLQRPADT